MNLFLSFLSFFLKKITFSGKQNRFKRSGIAIGLGKGKAQYKNRVGFQFCSLLINHDLQSCVTDGVAGRHRMGNQRHKTGEESIRLAVSKMHPSRPLAGQLYLRGSGHERREASIYPAGGLHNWATSGGPRKSPPLRETTVLSR